MNSQPAPADPGPLLDDPGQSPPAGAVDPEALRTRLVTALRSVYDPELPVNVYDLGLIYQLDVDDVGQVKVQLTLTAPACPVADQVVAEVHAKLRATADVARVQTQLVWDPPWSLDRMSEAARLELGFL
jgi:FeS assembly SUF system protein